MTVAQDPALTSSGTAVAQRVEGNNLANTLQASLHTDWTREFSTELTYANSFYDYENSGDPGSAAAPASYYGPFNVPGSAYVPALLPFRVLLVIMPVVLPLL